MLKCFKMLQNSNILNAQMNCSKHQNIYILSLSLPRSLSFSLSIIFSHFSDLMRAPIVFNFFKKNKTKLFYLFKNKKQIFILNILNEKNSTIKCCSLIRRLFYFCLKMQSSNCDCMCIFLKKITVFFSI